MIDMPRVWNGLRYDRRLHPLSLNVNQSLEPLSTANMILPPYDEIHTLDWVQISTPDGKTEYYRVASVDTEMATGQKEVYLEHGACSLGDAMIPEKEEAKETTSTSANGASLMEYPENKTDTIGNLLDHILDFQGTEYRWAPGTVQSTQVIYIELGGMSPLAAISSMMRYIPGYQLVFEQRSAVDWRVNIVQRPITPVCEGRLSRNLRSCEVSYDVKDICTRVYSKGVLNGYVESLNAAYYGIHAETKNLSDTLNTSQKAQILRSYLANRDHPVISINISGVELSQITGLPIDNFLTGTMCRIAIPWLGITENEIVIEKGYDDVLKNPEQVTVTLANTRPDLAIAVAKQNNKTGGGGGGGGGGQQDQAAKEKKRYETWFEQTDRYLKLLATDSEWDEAGQRHITAFGQLQVQSDEITSVVQKTGVDGLASGETLYSKITQTADALTTEVGRAQGEEAQIKSTVTQTATEIRSEVSAVDGRVSTVSQTVDGINISGNTINIKGNSVNLGDYVTVANLQANYATITDLDSVTAEVNNLKAGHSSFSSLSATSGSIGTLRVGTLTVGNDNHTSLSAISLPGVASQSFMGMGTLDLSHSHAITMSESGGSVTATIGAAQSASGTASFSIAATQFYQDGVAAARDAVSVSGSWSGSTYTATASNGLSSASTTISITEGSWSDGSIPVYAFDGTANRASGSVSIPAATSVTGMEYAQGLFSISYTVGGKAFTESGVQINASLTYNAGVAAGEAKFTATTVTLQGSQVSTSSRKYVHKAGSGKSFSYVANTTLYYNRGSGYEAAGTGSWYLGGSGTAYYEDGGYEYYYPNGTYYYAGSSATVYRKNS